MHQCVSSVSEFACMVHWVAGLESEDGPIHLEMKTLPDSEKGCKSEGVEILSYLQF